MPCRDDLDGAIPLGTILLYAAGKEEPLPMFLRIGALDIIADAGCVVLFMMRSDWCWHDLNGDLDVDGTVACARFPPMGRDFGCIVTGGEVMTEGRHFWEVELTDIDDMGGCMIGAWRPYMDSRDIDEASDGSACCIWGQDGGIWDLENPDNGYGMPHVVDDGPHAYQQGHFSKGDRIGVLLDLDLGWVRFYKNGKRCGPGYRTGVEGPLIRGAVMHGFGRPVFTAVPGAKPPPGAGGTDAEDPWEVGTREESSTRMHRYLAMLSQIRISEAEDYLREIFEPLLAEIMEAGYSPEKQSALEVIVAGAIEEFIRMIRKVEQTRSAAGFLGRGMDMMQHLRSATPGIVAAVRMEMSSKRD